MGPKHGSALGVAVFAAKGSAVSRDMTGTVGNSDRLRQWSLDHDVVFNDDAQSRKDLEGSYR